MATAEEHMTRKMEIIVEDAEELTTRQDLSDGAADAAGLVRGCNLDYKGSVTDDAGLESFAHIHLKSSKPSPESAADIESTLSTPPTPRKQKRRAAASNVFYDDQTLAIDYAIKSSTPKAWYKRKFKWKSSEAQGEAAPGIYDLEIVRLHMPGLLKRRNGSDNIVRITPELVLRKYELLSLSQDGK